MAAEHASLATKPTKAGKPRFGCGFYFIVIIIALVALFVYAVRESNREWAAAKPASLSAKAWQTKHEKCGNADLGAEECARTSNKAIERLIAAKTEEKRQTQCVDSARATAIRQAQKMVLEGLRAPATADFIASTTRAAHDGCDWTVAGSVDAENAFGANIRSRYRVRLQPISEDLWVPSSVSVE